MERKKKKREEEEEKEEEEVLKRKLRQLFSSLSKLICIFVTRQS